MGSTKDWIGAALTPALALNSMAGGTVGGLLGMDTGAPEAGSVTVESPTVLPQTPTAADNSVAAAAADERRRRQAARGASSTLLTGGYGLSGAPATGKKTLLGG